MNFKNLLILVIGLLYGLLVQGQSPIKTHNHQDLIWLGYFPKFNFGKHWAVEADLQFRRKDWGQEWSQMVFRNGLSYKMNENLVFSGGFAYLQHLKNSFIQREYRPYQQVLILNNFSGFKLDHRYRFEQRFLQRTAQQELADGFSFHYRMRYKVGIGLPLRINGKVTPWSVYADNEIMINFGEEVFLNLFDQNRLSVGFNYQHSDDIKVQLGYMNIYAQKASLGEFDDANIIRLNVYHTIKMNKTKG